MNGLHASGRFHNVGRITIHEYFNKVNSFRNFKNSECSLISLSVDLAPSKFVWIHIAANIHPGDKHI